MTLNILCSPLHAGHNTIGFSCGRGSELSDWLYSRALNLTEDGYCKVWVLSLEDDPDNVIAYFSLSSHAIVGSSVLKRHRSTRQSHPAQLLGKFAVDERYQGTGLGAALMQAVYEKYLEICALTGTRFLILHAVERALVDYYRDRYGFHQVSSQPGQNLTLLYKTTKDIEAELSSIAGAGIANP